MCSGRSAVVAAAVVLFAVLLSGCACEDKSGHQPGGGKPDAHKHLKEHEQLKFLGEAELKKSEKMNPRQARKELLRIVREVDTNKDGFITKDELVARLRKVHDDYINQSVLEMWNSQNPTNRTEVSWDDIITNSYAYLKINTTDEETKRFGQEQLERDEIRFKRADFDKNGKLSWTEYISFIYPETSPATKDIVVEETMKDLDKNKDGFVDVDEYVSDLWRNGNEGEPDPDWVTQEKLNFKLHRDLNGDNKLDLHELGEMLQPKDYDPFEAEASHLLYEADDNKDGKLSPEEMFAHSTLFMNNTGFYYIRDEL